MKKIIFLLLSVLIIQSCVDSNTDFTDPGSLAPGRKVIKKIKVNKAGSAPYEIEYNWTAGKLMSVSTTDNSLSYILEYNGKDLKKVSQTLIQGVQTKTRISNLIYKNGRLTTINGSESSAAPGGTVNFITTVSYIANNPYFLNKVYQNGSTMPEESIYLEFNGTNIKKINYVLGTGATSINTEVNLSNYDTDPNPLHTLPATFSITDSNVNQDSFGVTGLSTSNYRTANIQNTGVENTVYTYAADGYPIKSVKPNLVLQFEYTTL